MTTADSGAIILLRIFLDYIRSLKAYNAVDI